MGMDHSKTCNVCGKNYPDTLSFCVDDGSPLVEIDPLLGIVLDGRYRLNSLIGTGGMGDVYRATHVHLDAEFAVKLLKPEFVANQDAIKRFRLEAKAAGRIHHPNAVRVTDFGVTSENLVYLVMELVKGRSLRSVILDEGRVPYLRTVNLIRQVCGAVEAAHRGGVIHRDLKPDNILIEMVNGVERVKVLDFGIAKLREAKTESFLTQAGTLIGTPQYMSPEQCQSRPLDPTSDIYSIGIVLYEMLSGKTPFDGETFLKIVYDQLHLPPAPLSEVAPDVPEPIARVVMQALAKEPGNRPATALQLSEELRAAVEAVGESGGLSMTSPLGMPSPDLESGELSGIRAPVPEKSRQTRPAASGEATMVRQAEEIVTAKRQETKTGQNPSAETSENVSGNRRKWLPLAGIAVLAAIAILAFFMLRGSESPSAGNGSTTDQSRAPEGMALIPGGKFMMGRDDGAEDEGPAHEVTIQPFYLDIQEVTNQDYKKFVDATGHRIPKSWKSTGSYDPEMARFPVTHVTWDDATAYAKWTGKRLPTEAEWEYAAKGGDKQYRYPWGSEWAAGYANIDRKGQVKPAPVRSFERDLSPFGIYDLAGNVSEWVQDYYSTRYGTPPDTRFRVYRGGNFLDVPEKSTSTYRWSDYPTDIPDDQILRVGFRCAKDAPSRF